MCSHHTMLVILHQKRWSTLRHPMTIMAFTIVVPRELNELSVIFKISHFWHVRKFCPNSTQYLAAHLLHCITIRSRSRTVHHPIAPCPPHSLAGNNSEGWHDQELPSANEGCSEPKGTAPEMIVLTSHNHSSSSMDMGICMYTALCLCPVQHVDTHHSYVHVHRPVLRYVHQCRYHQWCRPYIHKERAL